MGKPDVERLARRDDLHGLIQALNYSDPDIQWQAAHAIAGIGHERLEEILPALRSRNRYVRTGIIGALSEIKDARALPGLIFCLQDRYDEVRWGAALALGEIGDPSAIPPLVQVLRDENKYVRHGAARALEKLRWKPAKPEEQAYYSLASLEWPALGSMGEESLPALKLALSDRDPGVRKQAVATLGTVRTTMSAPAFMHALADQDEEVRWEAVRSASGAGIAMRYLPRGLANRPQTRKNPYIAAFLNFILPGFGYFYLGIWWGILVFQIDVTLTVWLYAYEGGSLSSFFLLPVYAILAFHAWYIAVNMPDL
ncbi:MAG: HEAT repeat domain-containing protein [Methanomicrobiaceae archaeon]|nr:HEAT repeat domain-containing protein [Methanomicrobiaceae archaeon]